MEKEFSTNLAGLNLSGYILSVLLLKFIADFIQIIRHILMCIGQIVQIVPKSAIGVSRDSMISAEIWKTRIGVGTLEVPQGPRECSSL